MTLVLVSVSLLAQTRDWPAESPPRPLPSREVKFPPYEVRTLANGLQVVTVLHHEQPAVTLRLLVRAGAVNNPPGKPGLAALAASLLDQGTSTRSAEQIADTIDYIGGALDTGAGSDLTFINSVVMKDSFGLAMDLIADLVRNPAFAPEEIERQRQQALSGLQVSQTDPSYVANVVFDRLVYGFHPYGLPNSGTTESLAAMTRADLLAYHRKYFVPNNMILGIVGDVTGEEAFAAAERVFGKMPRAEVPPLKLVEPPPPTRRAVIVDMPDAVQTEMRVGHIGIPRKHRDYVPVDLAFRILGGEGANRLHRLLRSERGLTYGASADIETRKQGGDFVAETSTRSETTGEALRLIVDEFIRLQRQRVGDRELGDAQAYLSGNFPLTIETPDAIAMQVLNAVFFELPLDEIGTFPEQVQSVTPDDVQRVARTYLFPDRLSVVLVGNASVFVPQLKAAGFADYEVIPFDQVDLASPTLRKERRAGPARNDNPFRAVSYAAERFALPPRMQRAEPSALLQRVVDAKGGLERLKGIHSLVAEASTTFRVQQGPLPSKTTTYVIYPDRFRVDATIAGADVAQVYDRGVAWVRDPGGVHEAPVAMRSDFAASVQRDTIPLLIAAAERKLTTKELSNEGGEGRSYRVLEISGAALSSPVRLYIDSNGLIVRQQFSGPGPDGRPLLVEEVFSDYRAVGGIQVPFRAELRHNGRPILDRVLTDVKLNAAIDARLFERPER